MRYDDLHPCVRNALRANDIRDFLHSDAATKYLVEGALHPLAFEMEKVLVAEYQFSVRQAWELIERVLVALLPSREQLVAQQQAHDRIVRQFEQQTYDPGLLKEQLGYIITNPPRGQEATSDDTHTD